MNNFTASSPRFAFAHFFFVLVDVVVVFALAPFMLPRENGILAFASHTDFDLREYDFLDDKWEMANQMVCADDVGRLVFSVVVVVVAAANRSFTF